ncbi:Phosphorylase-like protein 2 [Elsinoe fawcettii]|nr:Phosphorylase-like protein 2 [Elsinoe fawcettii]
MEPTKHDFRIGWICALPVEAAAAKEMLDERYNINVARDESDTNQYTFGRIDQHFVVIARLPAGRVGNTAATQVAVSMLHTFNQSLRVVLMVGIGGGIPSPPARDIRLGDVAVSLPSKDSNGVVQYDMGKRVVSDGFQRTGCLQGPSNLILGAVGVIQEREQIQEHQWPTMIDKALGRSAGVQIRFQRPRRRSDRLFKAGFEHAAPDLPCSCSPAWEEHRDPRPIELPISHYGIIASGNSVVKTSAMRERILQDTGAVAFDMEAAGVMQACPALVIRGISDYSDSHKVDHWQPYAAMAAAAYAKEVTMYIPIVDSPRQPSHQSFQRNSVLPSPHNVHAVPPASNQFGSPDRYDDEVNLTQELYRILGVCKYESAKNINPIRDPETCQWALRHPTFREWLHSPADDLLVITADPGCGKSVLARSLIDRDILELCSKDEIGVICYFFFKDHAKQDTLESGLCSILHQLFEVNPALTVHGLPLLRAHGPFLTQDLDVLWRMLMAVVRDPRAGRTVIVFDGMDELLENQWQRLTRFLAQFLNQERHQDNAGTVKFLITSRPYHEVKWAFASEITRFTRLHIKGEDENEALNREIDQVVRKQVNQLATTLSLTTSISNRIENKLLSMRNRTYLWLHLAIDGIRSLFARAIRPDDVEIVLLPTSVNKAYEEILSRVKEQDWVLAKTVLSIVTAAFRPLSSREMAHALGLATLPDASRAAQAVIDVAILPERIRDCCKYFVFLDARSDVHLIHQSAKEFLLGEGTFANSSPDWFKLNAGEIQNQMAISCLRYLLMEDVLLEFDRPKPILDFLDYALDYWSWHVNSSSLHRDDHLLDHIVRFYCVQRYNDIRSEQIWTLKVADGLDWAREDIDQDNIDKLASQVAESVGEANNMAHESDTPFWGGLNALEHAAFNGHTDAVIRLIADHLSEGIYSEQSLACVMIWATERADRTLLEVLFESGMNINCTFVPGHKVMRYALDHYIAKITLPTNATSEDKERAGTTPLLNVILHQNRSDMLEFLIEHGADINFEAPITGTPLTLAITTGQNDLVLRLLELGANVNQPGGIYDSPLSAAILTKNYQVMSYLMQRNADISIPGARFGCPLVAALWCQEEKLALWLATKRAAIPDTLSAFGLLNSTSAPLLDRLIDAGLDYRQDWGGGKLIFDVALESGSLEQG